MYCHSSLGCFVLYVDNRVYICWGGCHLSVHYIVYNNPGRIENHLKSDYLDSNFLLNLRIIHTQYRYLHTGIKHHHLWLISHFLALFDVSFHYPENVGKYRIIFQNHLTL